MQFPSVKAMSSERVLNGNEIEKLPCTFKARDIASGHEGIVMESEFVTHDDRFGYIYRYDIVLHMIDDGSFHPELGTKGMIFKVNTKLMIYTFDCIHFKIVSCPLFELPNL